MKKVLIKTHLVGVDCEFLPNKEYELPEADAASIVSAGCGVYVDPVQVADSGGGGVEPPAVPSDSGGGGVEPPTDALAEAAAPEAAPEVVEETTPEVVPETSKAKKGKAK